MHAPLNLPARRHRPGSRRSCNSRCGPSGSWSAFFAVCLRRVSTSRGQPLAALRKRGDGTTLLGSRPSQKWLHATMRLSTPYVRSGVLVDDFPRGYGHDDPDLLVWRASSALMNPTITSERLDRERRLDPIRFEREYEAEFTDDLASAFEHAVLTRCVEGDVRERAPVNGVF